MTLRILTSTVCAVALFAGAAKADEVLDSLKDAIAAYEEGEIQETVEILEYAAIVRRMGEIWTFR